MLHSNRPFSVLHAYPPLGCTFAHLFPSARNLLRIRTLFWAISHMVTTLPARFLRDLQGPSQMDPCDLTKQMLVICSDSRGFFSGSRSLMASFCPLNMLNTVSMSYDTGGMKVIQQTQWKENLMEYVKIKTQTFLKKIELYIHQ